MKSCYVARFFLCDFALGVSKGCFKRLARGSLNISGSPLDTFTDTFLHSRNNIQKLCQRPSPKGSWMRHRCTMGVVTDCVCVLPGTAASENGWSFYLHLNQSTASSRHTWIHQREALDALPNSECWEECVSVFLIVCNDIPPGSFFVSFLLWISTFGCNYKYCHKTLPSVTCPSKPPMLVCLLNDDHYIFFPFQSHCTGNKVTQNHMLVCQALITDRRWSAVFWGLPFQFECSLFSLVMLCSVIDFPSSFCFTSCCSVQFVNKERLLWSRLFQ